MKRQSRTPWIYRYSRPLMAGIATVGTAVTAYLTAVKLTQGSAICPTSSCDVVLSSPYATVFGLPLALFGFFGYASMVILAISPLLVPQSNQQVRSQLESWTGLLLFAGGTAMTVFSGYLMYLLAFKIQAVCIYCIGSAILSTGLLILAIVGQNWQDVGQLLFTGFIVTAVVLVSTLAIYANANNPKIANSNNTSTEQLSAQDYPITTTSSQASIALAQHLKQVGAVFYGAFWCPHCHEQKQLFGKEAAQEIPYVECDPQGINPQTEQCQAAGVQGFPTWVINGQTLTGTRSLKELAQLSGYRGQRNFQSFQPTDK